MKTLSFLLSLLSGVVLGQPGQKLSQPVVQQTLTDLSSDRFSQSQAFDNRPVTRVGSPYYVPDWLPGEVTTLGGEKQYWGMVKVDVYNSRLWLKRAQGDSIPIGLEQVAQLTINPLANDQTTIRFQRFPAAQFADASLKNALMRVVHTGPYGTLIEHPVRKHYPPRPNDPYSHNATVDELRDESVLYVIRTDQIPTRTRLTRRALADALGETGPQFERYLRDNDVLLRSAGDVATALYLLSHSAK